MLVLRMCADNILAKMHKLREVLTMVVIVSYARDMNLVKYLINRLKLQ